ncbi:MAG TPA: hypothetical protein VF661_02865 [Actinomycetales bacterium]|jgi:hypothetical protein
MTTGAGHEDDGTPLTRDTDRDAGGLLNAAESDPSLEELSSREGEVRSAPSDPQDEATDGREPLNPA